MALDTFTVTGLFKAIVSDGNDPGGDPDIQLISGTATFTPSIREATTDGALHRLQPIIGRMNDDGVLRTIHDDEGVNLVCGDAAEGAPLHGLSYRVDFSNVVYDKQRNQRIESFRFLAPTETTTIDIATVERIPL